MNTIKKNVIVNLLNDEDQDSSVETVVDISNWPWLTFLFNESAKVEEELEEAVDNFLKEFTERFGSDEDEILLKLKACCQEFKIAVQSEIDARGGLDYCSFQLLTWGAEYDTNLTALITSM